MSSDYDPTEFVDGDFQSRSAPAPGAAQAARAPTREEVDSRVAEAQQRLVELKRAQEELERERSGLEETRRRQMEFETGRQEMIHHLTRGLGLLEEAEFNARRDAEQMARTLAGFRDALSKIEAIQEVSWTKDNFNVELTRALTAVENARMEWNSARLKFVVLSGKDQEPDANVPSGTFPSGQLAQQSFGALCKMGFALTWPLALLALAILVVLLVRR